MKLLSLHAKNIFALDHDLKLELDKGNLKDQVCLIFTKECLQYDPNALIHLISLGLYNRLAYSITTTPRAHHTTVPSTTDGRALIPSGVSEASISLRFLDQNQEEYLSRWHVSATRSGRLVSSKLELFTAKNGAKIGRDSRETLHEIEKRIKMSFSQFEQQFVLPYSQSCALLESHHFDTQKEILIALFTEDFQNRSGAWISEKYHQATQNLSLLEAKVQHTTLLPPAELAQINVRHEILKGQLLEKKEKINALNWARAWYTQEKMLQDQIYDLHQKIAQLRDDKAQQAQHVQEKETVLQSVWNRHIQLKTNYDLKKQEIEKAKELDWHIQSVKNNLGEVRIELREQYQKHQLLIEKVQEKETEIRQTEEKYKQQALWLNDHSVLATLSQREAELHNQLTHYLNKKNQIENVKAQSEHLSQTIQNLAKTLSVSQEKKQSEQCALEQLKHQIAQLRAARYQPERHRLIEKQQENYQRLSTISQFELVTMRHKEWEEKYRTTQKQKQFFETQLQSYQDEERALSDEIRLLSAQYDDLRKEQKRWDRLKHLGDLRTSLASHQACPICGSVDHPWENRKVQNASKLIQESVQHLDQVQKNLAEKQTALTIVKQNIVHVHALIHECTQGIETLAQNISQLQKEAQNLAHLAGLKEEACTADYLNILTDALMQEIQQIGDQLQNFAQLDQTYQNVQKEYEKVFQDLEDQTARCNQLHTERMLKEYQLTTVIERLNEFKYDLQMLGQQLEKAFALWRPDWEELLTQNSHDFYQLLESDLNLYQIHQEEVQIWEKQLSHSQVDLSILQHELENLKHASDTCKQALQEKNSVLEKLTQRRTTLLEGHPIQAYEIEMARQIQMAEKLVHQEQEMHHALVQRLMQIDGQLKQLQIDCTNDEAHLRVLFETKPTIPFEEIENNVLTEEQAISHILHECGMLAQQQTSQQHVQQQVDIWKNQIAAQHQIVQQWSKLVMAFSAHDLSILSREHYVLFIQHYVDKINAIKKMNRQDGRLGFYIDAIQQDAMIFVNEQNQQIAQLHPKSVAQMGLIMGYLFATEGIETQNKQTYFLAGGTQLTPDEVWACLPFSVRENIQIIMPCEEITMIN